jgi:UDP-2,3-diacylglucosamine hydrolase
VTIPPGQIFVIGDSHVGLGDGDEQALLAWLDRFVELSPRALYLNGDLFHYLIAHPKFASVSVDRVFAKLQEVRDRAIPIHYVEGNRDFFLEGSFAERAVTTVGMEFGFTAGPKRYLVVHGDMINDHDLPYRFWRWASKNPVSRLGIWLTPKWAAHTFVNSVERRLSASNFKHKSRLPIELMEAYGRKRNLDGYTDVIFGHFHQKVVIPAGDASITVLPPWYETGEAMIIDPATGQSTFAMV